MVKKRVVVLLLIVLAGGFPQRAAAIPVLLEDPRVTLPIIMYHEVKLNNPGKDAILPWELENDLRFLRDGGYTTVTVKDVEDYVLGGIRLPDKPVMLTFDDGYLNNYRYVFPLLKKYGMKIVLSILVKNTDDFTAVPDDNLNYAHVRWDQLNEMLRAGCVEIQNHTYNMHRITKRRYGCVQGRGEAYESYRALFEEDLRRSQDRITEMTGTTPTAFVYPYGRYNEATDLILKEAGFRTTLTCNYGINRISRDPECLYHLKRICRAHDQSLKKVLSEGMRALQYSMRFSGG